MSSKLYTDDAVVLRTQDLGEADRIITLYGKHHGKIRAVAKGVRKSSSRFGARLEPFQRVDIQLHRGKNLDTVSQVVTRISYADAISSDYRKYTVAAAMGQIIDKLTHEYAQLEGPHYDLYLGALHALAKGTYPPNLILDAFILRTLAMQGWRPALLNCASCGIEGPHYLFDPQIGGAVCSNCATTAAWKTRPAVLEHMLFLLGGQWEPALQAELEVCVDAGEIIQKLLEHQLDAPILALNLVERA